MEMIGIYIIDGLTPSPTHLVLKMQPNALMVMTSLKSVGLGCQQLQRSFRHFFGLQGPTMIPPLKEKCPNVKVDELFRWCRFVWKEAMCLAEPFSIDEQTCKMQRRVSTKLDVGSLRGLGVEFRLIVLLMMASHLIFTSATSNKPVDAKWV